MSASSIETLKLTFAAAFLTPGALPTLSTCFFTVLATPEPAHRGQTKAMYCSAPSPRKATIRLTHIRQLWIFRHALGGSPLATSRKRPLRE